MPHFPGALCPDLVRVYSNFRAAIMGADALKWLSPQGNATLLHLLYSMLTLKLL